MFKENYSVIIRLLLGISVGIENTMGGSIGRIYYIVSQSQPHMILQFHRALNLFKLFKQFFPACIIFFLAMIK